MTSARIHELFRTIAKLIHLDQEGETYAAGIKAAVVAVQEQNAAASGAADPYAELQGFIGPVLTSVRPVAQGLDRLALIAKSGIDNYIRTVAPELGQQVTAAPATILNALAAAMIDEGDSVAPSGALYGYVFSGYGVQLPQNDEPTIADEIITATIL